MAQTSLMKHATNISFDLKQTFKLKTKYVLYSISLSWRVIGQRVVRMGCSPSHLKPDIKVEEVKRERRIRPLDLFLDY